MVLSETCATFALSDEVTAETFVKLNSSCPKDIPAPQTYTNYFTPVMHDVSKMLKLSESPSPFTVEVFDEREPEELHELYSQSVSKQMPLNGLVGALACAALDERSVQDDTLIIYYAELTYADDDAEEPNGSDLYH